MKPFLAAPHAAHIAMTRFNTCALVAVTRHTGYRVYTVSLRRADSLIGGLQQLHSDVAAGRTRQYWPSGEFLPGGRYSGFLRRPEAGGANHG